MAKQSPRSATGKASRRPASSRTGRRFLLAAAAVLAVGAAAGLLMQGIGSRTGSSGPPVFKQVGRSGPVFTVSIPRARTDDDEYMMAVAQQISDEEKKAGGSGQISVMIWPDDVQVPKEPPTHELDASMKTQAAGIFINPTMNIKHLIRFKNGDTVSEKDFGKPTR